MSTDLKLGLNTGYWTAGPPAGAPEAIAAADELGFDSIWTAEAYGSDVLTPLAWWGSQTKHVQLGTAIMQMSARTPAAAAMAAMTMDHLSDGRFILGLGVSGPQVVEGWYGQAFGKPLAKTREYVAIVRDICAREGRVTAPGPVYPLPYPDGTGLGKPLKSTLHPVRPTIPIYLAAEGPKNIALTAEIADGWLALFYSPHHEDLYRPQLEEGFAREGALHTLDDFEIAASVPIIVHDDIEQAADFLRPMYALYFGGMGAKGANSRERADPDGLRERGRADPEAVPRGQEGRGRGADPDRARRAARADRQRRQDPARPRGVARVGRHDAADQRRRGDGAQRRGDRARLALETIRGGGARRIHRA
jgi:F420-dependent oxidoreductase-like protein